jgi:hypothetical protein
VTPFLDFTFGPFFCTEGTDFLVSWRLRSSVIAMHPAKDPLFNRHLHPALWLIRLV